MPPCWQWLALWFLRHPYEFGGESGPCRLGICLCGLMDGGIRDACVTADPCQYHSRTILDRFENQIFLQMIMSVNMLVKSNRAVDAHTI